MKAFSKVPPRAVGEPTLGAMAAGIVVPGIGYLINWWLDLNISAWWLSPFVPCWIVWFVSDEAQKREDGVPAMEWVWWGAVRAFLFPICLPLSRVIAWASGILFVLIVIALLVLAAAWIYELLSVKVLLIIIALALVSIALRRRR